MQLTLRRTYNDHPRPEDNDNFWSIDCDGYNVGSLVLHAGRSDDRPRWNWNLHMHPGRHGNGFSPATSGQAGTRDAALPEIRAAMERYLAHIGAEGWAEHVSHMELLKERQGLSRRRQNRA